MELYKNGDQFRDAVIETSRYLKISESLVEKDYFVMLLLRKLTADIPGLLFKGGTCCSHAYHAIDRFSEDIDLSLDTKHFGRNHNIEANHMVIKACDELGFNIANRDKVMGHSHGNFNQYYVEYPALFGFSGLKPYVQIEMAFYQKSYPHEIKPVNSLIGEWLIERGNQEAAMLFDLTPFDVCVQKLERTFVDKVFAICDYYERKETTRNSRHIYDLYKISKIIDLSDDSLVQLVAEVRADRKKSNRCVSASDDYDVNRALTKIRIEELFKSDYRQVTSKLLIKGVEYDEAISVLDAIIESGAFRKQ